MAQSNHGNQQKPKHNVMASVSSSLAFLDLLSLVFPASDPANQARANAHHNLDMDATASDDDRTNYRILRDGGWDNLHHFMISYGLKPYDPADYDKAKAIIQGFRERGYYRRPSESGSSS
ncbi:hypothetical protein BD289DRAFT_481812 [Coniella lustricola]|uniref:Uncharacterized protein n=1 Tax=Coniella lustricola TaxID=2025994 RepID=A0A2T3AB97_9PEZI|nr:hypothetical protein BD289DRAFT_481812 [Coniella lustricola]